MTETFEAVVVGSFDLGEADRIVRLLAADRGRTSIVVRRARSSQKRFAGLTELGSVLNVVVDRARAPLPVARELSRLAGPKRARDDLDRLGLLAYACELCAMLAPEHAPAEKLYKLLTVMIDRLEADDPFDDDLRVALEAKALTFAGIAPSFLRCARCGSFPEDPVVFDAEAGGVLHARCGSGKPVSARAVLTFEALRRTPLGEVCASGAVPPEACWLLSDFAQHHLGRGLNSRAFLSGLDGLPG